MIEIVPKTVRLQRLSNMLTDYVDTDAGPYTRPFHLFGTSPVTMVHVISPMVEYPTAIVHLADGQRLFNLHYSLSQDAFTVEEIWTFYLTARNVLTGYQGQCKAVELANRIRSELGGDVMNCVKAQFGSFLEAFEYFDLFLVLRCPKADAVALKKECYFGPVLDDLWQVYSKCKERIRDRTSAPTDALYLSILPKLMTRTAFERAAGQLPVPLVEANFFPERGYGFLNFRTVQDAQLAVKCLKKIAPEWHVEYSRSNRRLSKRTQY